MSIAAGTMPTILLAVAAFVVVTTEFVMVGLLPAIARELSVSVASAGQLVTLFAAVVMLAGPVLTALLGHVERKRLFVIVLLIFGASNALAAIAPSMGTLALARVIPALALPLFWGTASDTAAQLAGPEKAGKAVSTVYLGISAAMLFGIPGGTLAGDLLGWRGAFWALAAMSLLVAALLALFMPAMQPGPRVRLGQQLSIVRNRYFVVNVGLSVLVFTAMFTGYTYLAEILERVAQIEASQVGWWLMGFGAVGLIGNWLGGLWLDNKPLLTTAGFCLLLATGMAATVASGPVHGMLIVALAAWGIANTALYPICQVRVMQAAPGAQALAGTVNVSAANAGIAFGAMLGGVVIPAWGTAGAGYVGAAVALLAAGAAIAAQLRE